MQWSDIPFRPKTKELRQFAGLSLLVFGGLAAWRYWSRGFDNIVAALAVLALAIGPIGLVKPNLIRWIYVGWMIVAFPIGWTVSRIMMGILFYGIFTPIALWFRLIGRDPLDRRLEPGRASYWTPKPAPVSVRSYFRQF